MNNKNKNSLGESIWFNKYLRNIIFHYIKIYNRSYFMWRLKTNFKYKEPPHISTSDYKTPQSSKCLTITLDPIPIIYLLPKKELKQLELKLILRSSLFGNYEDYLKKVSDSIKLLNDKEFQSLIHLSIKSNYFYEPFQFNFKLSNNLKSLLIYCKVIATSPSIPQSSKDSQQQQNQSILPDNLEKLEFEYYYIDMISSLDWSKPIESKGFDQELLPNQLPQSLKYLSFSDSLYGKFNNGGHKFKNPNIFPNGLVYLNLGNEFDQVIDEGILPNTLKTLIFGIKFSKALPKSLPSDLEILFIKNKFYSHSLVSNNENSKLIIKLYNTNLYKEMKYTNSIYFLPYYNHGPHSMQDSLFFIPKPNFHYIEFDYLSSNEILEDNRLKKENIKTLVVNTGFNKVIDLKNFCNLENIIINGKGIPTIVFTESSCLDKSNNIGLYNLKSIKVSKYNYDFLFGLQSQFYQLLEFN